MAIDPQMAAVVARLQVPPTPGPEGESPLALRRRIFRERAPWFAGDPVALAAVEDLTLPGAAGPIRGRRYDPTGEPGLPLLVYAHGGGWVVGDLDSHDTVCRILAHEGRCIVLSVDYRLAPEHPVPAGHDDMDAVVAALGRGLAVAGWDGRRLAVGGDSAGGHIATIVAARRRDDPRLRGQLLIYPVTDARTDTEGYRRPELGVTLTAAEMVWYWETACPDAAVRALPELSPVRRTDLAGLPPAFVLVAELDPLNPEGIAYAEALGRAGVAVELVRATGLGHGFARMTGAIDEARRRIDEAGAFLRRILA